MVETTAEPKPTDTITVLESFDAMRLFLEIVWERQGKPPEDIAFILGGSRWADGSPADPMIWQDWLLFEFAAPQNGNDKLVRLTKRKLGGRAAETGWCNRRDALVESSSRTSGCQFSMPAAILVD